MTKRIITYGTFDLLHYGHINILNQAKKFGDCLVVGLSSDKFNKIKNKKSYFTYETRKAFLESLKCVDQVIEENDWEQKIYDIKKYNIDIFVMGDDWKGKFDCLNKYCEVVYLPRTKIISTTLIKKILGENDE